MGDVERSAAGRADMLERPRLVAQQVVTIEVEIEPPTVAVEDVNAHHSLSGTIRQGAVEQLIPERESHRREADAGSESQDDRRAQDRLLDDQSQSEPHFAPGNDANHPEG